jgi:hypothetical protein
MKKLALVGLMWSLAFPAAALEKIWGNPNWSGFWDIGVGGGYTESNFLARVAGIDIDLSDDTIDSLGSPDDEIYAMPVFGFRYGYTMNNEKTHIFVASDQGDLLQFETNLMLAVRYDFKHLGSMQADYLSPGAMETEVWSDPYAVGQQRTATEQSTTGGRFTWDKVFGTGLEVIATYRDRELDDESSGATQGLTDAERQLLSREGDVMSAEVGYLMKFGGEKHSVRPSLRYINRDLDGDAMAQDGFGADLSYTYATRRFRWRNKIGYASLDGDKVNPLFGKTNDVNRFSVSTRMFFPRAFGWKNWMPVFTAAWAIEDSDINFNDTTTLVVSTSIYRDF